MHPIAWTKGSFQPSPCLQLEQPKLLVVGTRQEKKEGIFVCMIRGAIVLISRHEKLNSPRYSIFGCLGFSRKMPCCCLCPRQMLQICKSHELEQNPQTQTINNRAMNFFECVLPAFSTDFN
jgi:hypothetical protein